MTLLTLGDSDVRMVALIDVDGRAGRACAPIDVRLPLGYELTSISGSSLDTSDRRDDGAHADRQQSGRAPASVPGQPRAPARRRIVHAGHRLRHAARHVQRERGEVAIEGVGTLELTAAERDGVHRIDVRELNPALQSLARLSDALGVPLSADREQRARRWRSTSSGSPTPACSPLSPTAPSATTLVTTEGRALTEIVAAVQNRAQPFLKVMLPPGASMVSVEVAGAAAKPALGADGTRVPLLRPGFRPSGTYPVSFVYLHAGTPFARKGDLQMTLPRMDIPVGMVEWEVFVPDRYSVRPIGGNVVERRAYMGSRARVDSSTAKRLSGLSIAGGAVNVFDAPDGRPGEIRGRVTDQSKAALPGVEIVAVFGGSQRSTVTDDNGMFVLMDLPAGTAAISARLQGFQGLSRTLTFDPQQPRRIDFELRVAGTEERVTVTAERPVVDVQSTTRQVIISGERVPDPPVSQRQAPAPPSQNVINLQQRASGVLPIRVDVPRAGTSHQFVKPLVVDQEAVVNLRYKRR